MKYFVLIIAIALTALTVPSFAQDQPQLTASVIAGDSFVKKRHSIKGGWDIERRGEQTIINFDEDFRTKSGPDLKVYLSKSSLANLDSKTIANEAVKIAVLKSNRGQQSYIIPENIDLSEYKSVVIHCEAFAIIWGGFDIADASAAP